MHTRLYILPILFVIAFAEESKTYKTVKIGKQTWMAENLNLNASGSVCYDDKPANCDKYGRLYDWNTAIKICPKGWHLPSDADWGVLMKSATKSLKAKSGWNDYKGEFGNGTDEYGFSALPGGTGYSDGYFFGVGNISNWWTSSEYDSSLAYIRGVSYINEYAHRNEASKSRLYSVRCLYSGNNFVDSRDGNRYYFVKISKQTWMAENLNYNASDSRCYKHEPDNCDIYGRLYNWSTARKVCPKGWHLPSDAEWGVLMKNVNPDCSPKADCVNAGKLLKAKIGWNDYKGESGNGTDAYGFTALPGDGGNRYGEFANDGGYNGRWWTSSELNAYDAYYWLIFYYKNGASRSDNDKRIFCSVRCLKD